MLRKKSYSRPHRAKEPSEPGLFSSGYGKANEHAIISSFLVSAVKRASRHFQFFCSGHSASPSPLRNVTSTPESSGESYGTVTRTTKRMSSTHLVLVVPRATYISRKKRNRETCWRQSKFNVKRNANLWRNLKSVTKPQRLFQGARQLAPTRNFLAPYTSAIGLLCYMATRTCFSVHNAVLSTLLDH